MASVAKDNASALTPKNDDSDEAKYNRSEKKDKLNLYPSSISDMNGTIVCETSIEGDDRKLHLLTQIQLGYATIGLSLPIENSDHEPVFTVKLNRDWLNISKVEADKIKSLCVERDSKQKQKQHQMKEQDEQQKASEKRKSRFWFNVIKVILISVVLTIVGATLINNEFKSTPLITNFNSFHNKSPI